MVSTFFFFFRKKKKTYIFLAFGGNLPSSDTVQRRLHRINEELGLIKIMDCCSNGCYLYPEGSQDDMCPECDEPRFERENGPSISTMSVTSVGAALAEKIMDDDIFPLFSYRDTYDEAHRDGMYTDIFSGSIHQSEYVEGGELFQNKDDIGLMLVVDGFQPRHKAKTTMTTICCYIMNLDPAER